jgi:hypothetical protein
LLNLKRLSHCWGSFIGEKPGGEATVLVYLGLNLLQSRDYFLKPVGGNNFDGMAEMQPLFPAGDMQYHFVSGRWQRHKKR